MGISKTKFLLECFRKKKALYVFGIIGSAIAALLSAISPLIIKYTIDSIIGTEISSLSKRIDGLVNNVGGRQFFIEKLWLPGLVLISVTLLNGLFQYIKGRTIAVSTTTMAKSMQDKLYDHFQKLYCSEYSKIQAGDLLQRSTSDVETTRNFLAMQLPVIGEILFTVTSSFIIMMMLNVKITLLSIAVVPLVFSAAIIFFKKMQKVFKKVEEAESDVSTALQENLSGVRVVRAFGRQKYEIERYGEKNTVFRSRVVRMLNLISWYFSSSNVLCMCEILIVLLISVSFASKGIITLGTMIALLFYVKNFLWPIRDLGRILADMGKMSVSLERIIEVLNIPKEVEESEGNHEPIQGKISFKNVFFKYCDNDTNILENISFEVEKGQTIGILGPTGCGKSSLISLIARLYDPSEGQVLVDDVDITNINIKHLRQNIGLVLQEPFLFSRTIKENIKFAEENALDVDIEKATQIAAVHDTINGFDKGYDTLIGEKGVTLSGGQKQRVAIARAVIKNNPILIFDDSLSAVDIETDLKIREALNERSKDVTTIIISHRIATLSDCDFIMVLDDGKIKQKGNHKKLVKEEGLYRRIWSIQNSMDDDFMSA